MHRTLALRSHLPGGCVCRSRFVSLTLNFAIYAQDARGANVGTVTDATGAVVPGAPVEVVSKSMGTVLGLRTNDPGFSLPRNLIPGMYQVKVEISGI